MINKKNILITAFIVALLSSNVSVNADSSNDLLKMDVKRSSVSDTVDVTFYTTGSPSNSVVTRKDNNRYVVLLPNTSSNASIAPSIGGIKDLVTDIKVKNVNDGLGGYTKVTFSTTKPIKIQTYTKKTAPLTKAQQDYKSLIAQNSKYDADKKLENFKKTSTPTTTQNNKSTTSVQPAKAAQPKQTQNVSANKNTVTPKESVSKEKQQANKQTKPVSSLQTKTTAKAVVNEVSKKPVKQPVVPEKEITSQPTKQVSENIIAKSPVGNPDPENKIEPNNSKVSTAPVKEKSQKSKPVISFISGMFSKAKSQDKKAENAQKAAKSSKLPHTGLIVILGLLMLSAIVKRVPKTSSDKNIGIKNLFEVKDSNTKKVDKEGLEEIINDESMNWQEKFKRYTAQTSSQNDSSDYSYVTDMSASKSAILTPEVESVNIPNIPSKNSDIISSEKTAREKLNAKISQMEHILANTPSVNEEIVPSNKGVVSEDDAITSSMEHVKLRSFARNKSLKKTSRSILRNDKTTTQPMKEGKFVKLKNSLLSVNRRDSGAMRYGLSIADLIKNGSKYLNNDGVKDMDRLNENYSQVSLDEYMSILDRENVISEENKQKSVKMTMANNISNPITSTYKSASKSESVSEIQGMTVQSGYSIDNEKGFYLVKMDGISTLVGKIDEDIFVLKKFDKIINQPIQVRLDYGSVYIVRVGGFKCLVEVSEDKMGTLLEI